jgi:hypothetical protein
MYRRDTTTFEYAYWLQGALEISQATTLTPSQIARMRRKLFDIEGFETELLRLLQGVTEEELAEGRLSEEQALGIRARRAEVPEGLKYPVQMWLTLTISTPDDALRIINTFQHRIFTHDIDPTYDGDQDYFHAIHRGEIDPE